MVGQETLVDEAIFAASFDSSDRLSKTGAEGERGMGGRNASEPEERCNERGIDESLAGAGGEGALGMRACASEDEDGMSIGVGVGLASTTGGMIVVGAL